jgi:hypothetical protein
MAAVYYAFVPAVSTLETTTLSLTNALADKLVAAHKLTHAGVDVFFLKGAEDAWARVAPSTRVMVLATNVLTIPLVDVPMLKALFDLVFDVPHVERERVEIELVRYDFHIKSVPAGMEAYLDGKKYTVDRGGGTGTTEVTVRYGHSGTSGFTGGYSDFCIRPPESQMSMTTEAYEACLSILRQAREAWEAAGSPRPKKPPSSSKKRVLV